MHASTIILLNGSSSSGKTTLAQALQQQLPDPYQHIALDQFRDGLAGRYRGLNSPGGTPGSEGLNIVPTARQQEPVTEIRFGAVGERMLAGMRRAVAAFAHSGNNVIVDDLLFEPRYLHDYQQVFADLRVYFVGVRCDLATVNERESKRVGRFPGTATSHFESIHAHGVAYDVEVDTAVLTPAECALAVQQRMRMPPQAFVNPAATAS
ncbi:MAG: chloramphenicol phosphotransferase CPT family protein [Pseudomonadales bacterium]